MRKTASVSIISLLCPTKSPDNHNKILILINNDNEDDDYDNNNDDNNQDNVVKDNVAQLTAQTREREKAPWVFPIGAELTTSR